MLTRRKLLLELLHQAGRPLERLALVKLAFLLRHEFLAPDQSFYDFVPYKYGPFSFTLYRELGPLARDGYVDTTENMVALRVAAKDDLPQPLREAVGELLRRYGSCTAAALIREVYARYPWYASRSEIARWRPVAPSAPATARAVYTAGYEGGSVDRFFDRLLRQEIRAIADVRANPVSRQYGFARRSMSEIAAKLGLEYTHWPELGIPSAQRKEIADEAARRQLLDEYAPTLLAERRAGVARLASYMQARPTALVCLERDPSRCHRSRLAEATARLADLPVTHL